MKKMFILTVAALISTTCLFAQKAGKVDTVKHATFYSCTIHPQITNLQAGKCTICGMELTLSGKEKMKADQLKNYVCPIHFDLVSHNPGNCPKCGKEMNLSKKEQMKVETTKIYTCPMHPMVALDKNGYCPKCGKELIEKKKI